MRLRIFLILFVVLLLAAVAVVLVVNNFGGLSLLLGNETPDNTSGSQTDGSGQEEPLLPTPTATPAMRFIEVLVARVRLMPGTVITPDLLTVELRPEDNVAVRANYTFSNPDELEGRIVGTEIPPGQAILNSMLALNSTDLASFGSDLALYVSRGNVAVAFPVDQYSGIAYAMRPGDKVDVFMSLVLQRVDEEFQSPLPNVVQLVDQEALLAGEYFFFPDTFNGRLAFIPEISTIGFIIPPEDIAAATRQVTQLTIQQAEVLWVGTWEDPRILARGDDANIVQGVDPALDPEGPAPIATPSFPARVEREPDLVILSMTAQDALLLKWALEVGINIHLALRAQGDGTVYVTTSVSLPQMVEQSGITIPEQGEFREYPAIDQVPTPGVPALPPTDVLTPP
ncbi:MAG: hypothetical protein IPL78_02845 [Chloroflexi bacterium]|nr:hypothetical protein [Chloroflexota bacterium]